MRSTLFALLIAVAAVSGCASAVKPVANIPATRRQIDETIATDTSVARRTSNFQYEAATPGARASDDASSLTPSRKITAMGRVTPDSAIVYTKPDGRKLEETWVREPDGWKLSRVKELSGATGASAHN